MNNANLPAASAETRPLPGDSGCSSARLDSDPIEAARCTSSSSSIETLLTSTTTTTTSSSSLTSVSRTRSGRSNSSPDITSISHSHPNFMAPATPSSSGTKRASEPDSPIIQQSVTKDRTASTTSPLVSSSYIDTIREEDWRRGVNGFLERPPFPISLVGKLLGMARQLVSYLQRWFVNRPDPYNTATSSTTELAPYSITNINQFLSTNNRFRRKNTPAISLHDYTVRICNYLTALDPAIFLTVLSYALRLDPPLKVEKDEEKVDSEDVCNIAVTGDESNLNIHKLHQVDNHEPSSLKSSPACSTPLQQSVEHLRIDRFSVHRFLITAIVLASKALGDHFYANNFYAKVGGISVRELNILELDMAFRLDWRLQCPPNRLASLWNDLCADDTTKDDHYYSQVDPR